MWNTEHLTKEQNNRLNNLVLEWEETIPEEHEIAKIVNEFKEVVDIYDLVKLISSCLICGFQAGLGEKMDIDGLSLTLIDR